MSPNFFQLFDEVMAQDSGQLRRKVEEVEKLVVLAEGFDNLKTFIDRTNKFRAFRTALDCCSSMHQLVEVS